MMISDWISMASEQLRPMSLDAKFEARRLLEEYLSVSAAHVVAHSNQSLSDLEVSDLESWLVRRRGGEPLAYICGRKEFYGRTFEVGAGVLIPRPETELVIEVALMRYKFGKGTAVDLGSGSGCIGVTLAMERPDLDVVCIEASSDALQYLQKNVSRHGLEKRVSALAGRIPDFRLHKTFDLVVANPPYIKIGDERVETNVLKYEPSCALFAGLEGLEEIKNWSIWAFAHLRQDGLFVCEIGTGQYTAVKEIMGKTGFRLIEINKDLAGHERVVSAVR